MNHDRLNSLLRRAAEYSINGRIDSGDLLRAALDHISLQPPIERAIQWAISDTVGRERPNKNPGHCDLSPDAQELLFDLQQPRPSHLWRNILKKRVGISGVILDRAGLRVIS